jgi:hypothetical protein
MNQLQILHEHERLCDEVHQGTLEENRFLRLNQRPPDAAILERKTALRARLDASLAELRTLPAGGVRDAEARARLERTRNRILQILQLDCENEQLLLRCSLAATRVVPSPPASSLIRKIYGSPQTP